MKKRKGAQSEEADKLTPTPKKRIKNVGKDQVTAKTPKLSSAAEQTKSVQLDSLQSIFATTDKKDTQFTLFGGPSLAEEIIEIGESPPLPTISVPTLPPQPPVKPRYFFPHFDDPVKNANSLFAETGEPFFHDRTEYFPISQAVLMSREEKKQAWEEERYELTQDWKKKRKAAMKMKRRMDIRRKL
jgi:hypothetical protein